ncbi:MAG: chromosome segregation protein SMC [Candidatus Rokubacteria bacterium GWC2_70_16]|nr:MAG: chromosome segregation protein SMC [Candidatus Rokubacteria bacterium GWC2_70_16]
MRLQQIVIHGFKSFAEKTEVRALPGITCVVGPNGCGKSNVADAIRWALGEQSPKTLRGHRMEDVIFHGSASRKSIGMAEVTLVFDNDGTLSVPWSEVSVARRLYRTGDSEYLLNKNVCRLRDLQDLFAGTGVNPKAYALMDQERLNHVLAAQPWERRAFIEEAAGIARYKQQRAEAQGKLAATRQNLQRVRDVMDTERRQLASLERQARKAQQYKALHQERQALALAMVAADFAALTSRHEVVAAELARLRAAAEERQSLIAVLAARETTQRAEVQEVEYRLADLRQSVQKVQLEAERLIERRDHIGTQLREIGDEDIRLAEEIRTIGERRLGLGAEREEKTRGLAEARQRHAEHGRRVGELETLLAQSRTRLAGMRSRLESLRLEQVKAAGRRAELTREAGELRERTLNLQRGLDRLEGELGQARAEARRLAVSRGRLEAHHHRTGEQLSLLVGEQQQIAAELAEREGLRAHMQATVADLRLALAGRQSQLDALTLLEREREGYGAGVRAVFAEGGAALRGVVGTVADLLEVPPGLETAVEGVLGDRLQWVVVERFEHARAALGYLEREGAGAATFLPLETLPADGGPVEDSDEVRWAARLVGGPHPSLLRYLLGRVGIVAHLDQAETLWRRNGVVATYVTPTGEVLSPAGRLTGGRRDGGNGERDHSILRRKGSIRQLREEVEALERDASLQRGLLDALEADIQALRSREAGLRSSLQAQEAARVAGSKDLEATARDEERNRRHLETLEAEGLHLAGERVETTARGDEVEAALCGVRETEAALEGEMEAVRERVEVGQREEGALAGDFTACRVEFAAVAERVDALARDLDRLQDLAIEAGARLEQSTLRRAQMGERRAELEQESERADARAREVVAERDRLEAQVRVAAEAREQRAADCLSLEAELRGAEQERQRLVGRVHALELDETEGRVRREELLQEARRSHGVEGRDALLAAHDPSADLAPVKARHEDLGARLEAMGAVNLVADEEYRELEERINFLRAQHDDLVASIKDLEKAIRRMTGTAQERFREAFDRINHHFSNIFARLFEGGRAELRMVEAAEGEDDPLELGVELMAQPRGKRLQAVSLMSGGEKALTGLALLFAIFYYHPSPFCVLDEVDAPLDDANIHRFLRVLRELCAHTQFIVITHNRKTMEAADVLYGVTMEEPGLSRLVSVKLTEA